MLLVCGQINDYIPIFVFFSLKEIVHYTSYFIFMLQGELLSVTWTAASLYYRRFETLGLFLEDNFKISFCLVFAYMSCYIFRNLKFMISYSIT